MRQVSSHGHGEYVEPMLLATHPLEERGHFVLIGAIDAHGNADPSGRRDEFGGFLDRLGPPGVDVVGQIRLCPAAAPGAVHGGARFSEHQGDPTPGTTRVAPATRATRVLSGFSMARHYQ